MKPNATDRDYSKGATNEVNLQIHFDKKEGLYYYTNARKVARVKN